MVGGRFLGVERRLLARALPLTLAYALVLASLYVLKPARNALFLSRIGVAQLPWVLLLVALVGGVFALVYGRLTRGLTIDALVQRTFLVLIGVLGVFRYLLSAEQPPSAVVYGFYVWVALHGLLSTSLVWLLANGLFTAREARGVFGLIGTGGIGGAIIGGLVTGELADRVGTENLLVVCMGMLLACLGLFRLLPPSSEAPVPKRSSDESPTSGLGSFLSLPLLRYLALTTGLVAAVAVIVDVQFNEVVDRSFVDEDAKAAFFGRFFAGLSAFSFVFQLVLTPFVLRSLGVGFALTILPAALGVGSLGLLLVPGLLAGMAAKSADGGFRHSVHKAASEVLFLPVPGAVKKQSKLFLDTTVDTTATGLGALAVLVLVEQLGLPYEHLGYLSVPLILGALLAIRKLKRAYVDAFRQALEGRRIDLSELTSSLAEAGALELLRPALRSERPRQVAYALDLLTGVKAKGLPEALEELFEHPSPEIRRRALRSRSQLSPPVSLERLQARLQDTDPEARALALGELHRADPEAGERALEAAMYESSSTARAAAVLGLGELRSEAAARLAPSTGTVQSWLSDDALSDEQRRALARAVAELGNTSHDELLRYWASAGPPALTRAIIEGLGRGAHERWLEWLMGQLERPELRGATRAALVAIGGPSVPRLAEALRDEALAPSIRRALPRVLARIPTQGSVDVLLEHVLDRDPVVARSVHRALARLRSGYPDLRFRRRKIERAIVELSKRHRSMQTSLRDLGALPPAAGLELLRRSVEETLDEHAEACLDLLVLQHDPEDIQRARRGLRGGADPEVRSAALELLDNLLAPNIRAPALTLLEVQASPGAPRSPSEGLIALLDGPSSWLRACAAHVAAALDEPELRRRVIRAQSDPSPFVREAAGRALALTADLPSATRLAAPPA